MAEDSCVISKEIQPDTWTPPLIVIAGKGVRLETFFRLYGEWLEYAEVVVVSRHLQYHPAWANKEVITMRTPVEHVIREAVSKSHSRRVLFLASGDPLFFGIGGTITRYVPRDNILILPNISVIQYLFSKIRKSWDNVYHFSLHGRENREFFFWLRQGKDIVLFTDETHNPHYLARLLLDYGFDDLVVVVGERLGTERERVVCGSIEDVLSSEWAHPNVVALFPTNHHFKGIGFYEDDAFHHNGGMITKREIRAVVCGALCLKPGHVLWDLGAGSGSISIEACSAVPLSVACAVEKNECRYRELVENVKNFGCGEIECILDDALHQVEHLPVPDRIFIGGSGPSVVELIERIINRFDKPFPTVLTGVTLNTLHIVEQYARNQGYRFDAFQMSVYRAVPISDSHRLQGINPVWVIRLGFS